MVNNGKRTSISTDPTDPCADILREEWMDNYVANGGKVEQVTLPSNKVGCTKTSCPQTKNTLSEKEANQLFKELKANKNIPFDYPVDCCYSRAHSMCRTIENKGIGCQKLWYFDQGWGTNDGKASLHPHKPDGSAVSFPDSVTGNSEPIAWVYHVAPTVKVKKADGTIQDMVMDPSLADRPLTKDEWKTIQGNPKGAYEEVTDSNPYFSNKKLGYYEPDPDMKETCAQLEKHKKDRGVARSLATKKP
ncbi:MAG: protein-glutamine glutaminase family protein [Methylococcales bacterium]|nr:protein-glutamine glutaminase family protein [Methylococcales bacterium]